MRTAEYKNGKLIYRDMTEEEAAEAEYNNIKAITSESALKEFATGLSTATTISEIRKLAKKFIEKSE